MDTIIENYLNDIDFDIRKTNNARFIDQKVTPDVLSIISDCILEFVWEDSEKEFTTTDIWNSNYTKTNILDIFRKPDIDNPNASNEYDKFFGQPLKMLWYSQILCEEKRWRRNYYKINNYKILEYISIKERNSLKFIQKYLYKVLKDSWILNLFNDFFDQQDKDSFYNLKQWFVDFMISNTPINEVLEPKRIFTKIINPLAFWFRKHWTIRWYFSKYPISYDDLMYNRTNWRDIWNKKTTETREEYELRSKEEVLRRRWRYTDYSINRAKRIIYKLYHPNSEMNDELSNCEATQVHHIFMKSEFPKLADYVENLILLTGSQHSVKAHPSNNTRIIDKDYQLLLLLAKSDNIKRSLDNWEIIYSFEDFIHVLNTGLNTSISINSSFYDITTELSNIYNKWE